MDNETTTTTAEEKIAPETAAAEPNAAVTNEVKPDGTEANDVQKPEAAKPKEDERTSAFKEIRAHNKQLEKELRELRQTINQRVPQAPEPTVDSLVKPTLAMFGGDTARYEQAVEYYAEAKKSIEIQTKNRESESKNRETQEHNQALEIEFAQKLSLSKSAIPHLDEVLARINSEHVGDGIDDSVVVGIKRSPVSAELLCYLEENRGETAKIEAMPAKAQAAALGAIEKWIMRGQYSPKQKAAPVVDLSLQDQGTQGTPAQPVRTPPRPNGGGSVTHTPTLSGAKTPNDYYQAIRSERMKARR